MRRSVDRLLSVSTAALLLSSFLALASAPTLGADIMTVGLLLLALWPLGEYMDGRFTWYRYATNGATALFSVSLPMWVGLFGLLTAVIILIIFIQAHKLAHRKERKDFYQLFFMCFLLVVAACGLGPDASIGLVMLFALVSAVWALLALQVRTEISQVGPSGLADVIPLSEREPEAVSHSARLLDWGTVRSVSVVCIASVVLTAGFFFGTPRMEAGILGRSNLLAADEAATQTGLSDTVEIGQGGRIAADHTPVMRVEFPDNPDGRYDGALYWRSNTMDTFTAGVWERLGGPYGIHDGRPRAVPLATNDPSAVAREPTGKGQQVRQSIYLEDVPSGGLPCLPSPLRLECDGATVNWDPVQDGHFVRVERRKSATISYQVVSEIVNPTPEQLRGARTNYDRVISGRDYFLLTRHTLEQRTVRLAQQLAEGQDTPYDKARALEAWLGSDAFSYTLDTPSLPRHSPIDAFLFEARRGHCELFASALALMLRSLGIPTRVVSGYRGGEWSETDRAYIVSRDMAHLWVEAYFLDYGWVTFDPSPQSGSGFGSLLERAQLAVSRLGLRLRIAWYSGVIGYKGGFNLGRIKDLGGGFLTWVFTPYTGLLDDGGPMDKRPGFLSFLALPGMVASVVLALVYVRLKRKSPRSSNVLTDTQKRAVHLLARVNRLLKRRGIDSRGKTAGELLLAARNAHLEESGPLTEALHTYNEARFGKRPLDKVRLKQLMKGIRAVR
ncbi:MAG TPA: DUF3488 and transglutaminase-like domain-containing protein [Candidatus Hydrogenedentes bacterium]|nr:DUF3488 and transglutaminase-like domain-containing protein [Candidatus Hydrogenedentota bacterium]